MARTAMPAGRSLGDDTRRDRGGAIGRRQEFLVELGAVVPDPHVGLAIESALRLARRDLEPYVTGAAYLNFTEMEERSARSASAFSDDHRRRLAALKAKLDPRNRFCHGVVLS
ncbi:BBE domain-containing protein [Gordonia bronchialis]|uniref:BBE domain-containing protein n=1 Tax=Gordonia bronchialis TaxID=2054 RepID=UPI00019B85D6|nr:BBE domain-containing protein [Gordonia bronchialis]MCC3324794.1 BBE domain-containing protein [Gordonia bronchialis]